MHVRLYVHTIHSVTHAPKSQKYILNEIQYHLRWRPRPTKLIAKLSFSSLWCGLFRVWVCLRSLWPLPAPQWFGGEGRCSPMRGMVCKCVCVCAVVRGLGAGVHGRAGGGMAVNRELRSCRRLWAHHTHLAKATARTTVTTAGIEAISKRRHTY